MLRLGLPIKVGSRPEEAADAAAVGQHLVGRHRADPVGVGGDEDRAAAQEVTGALELFIDELGVEALHDHVDAVGLRVTELVVDELDAVAEKLAVKGLRPGDVHARAGVVLVEVHARGHAGGEDVLPLAGEAQAAQTVDVVLARAGGVVRQVDVLLPHAREVEHQLARALVHLVAEIQGPVHVKEKEFAVFQFGVVHQSFSFW